MPPTTDPSIRILFVCLGNICRSPLAEGVFRDLVEREGLADRFEIDSAGTGGWHVGEAPDPRMQETASSHGLDIGGQRGRQVSADDLDQYDYVLAMDRSNLAALLKLPGTNRTSTNIRLFRDFDPEPDDGNVPDPYYGTGMEGFDRVYRIVERTANALLDHLVDTHDLKTTSAAS